MEKTRLEILSNVISVTDEIKTRESAMGGEIDPNCDEFIIVEDWYNVLKEDELNSRLSDLLNECYTAEELLSMYGTEDSDVAAESADIEIYLTKVVEVDGYIIYKTI